ncbi:MAG TPA: carboxypeptidase-like regulatory domain-containing protein, partial [Pyrinomonadaceae bacterium]
MIKRTETSLTLATAMGAGKAPSPNGRLTFLRNIFSAFAQATMLALFVLVAACAVSTSAQQTTGAIRGIVTDPNGAVVAGAKVTISSEKLNYRSETATSAGGEYEFRDVLPGEYQIVIEAASFKTLTLTDVRAELNKTTDVPAQL